MCKWAAAGVLLLIESTYMVHVSDFNTHRLCEKIHNYTNRAAYYIHL